MAVLEANIVASLLHAHEGNMAQVARECGVTRQAVHQFVADRKELRSIARDCREAMKDTAESSLYKAIKAGDPWAVCFFLKCTAKERGYVERMEIVPVQDDELDNVIDNELARLAPGRKEAITYQDTPTKPIEPMDSAARTTDDSHESCG